MDFFARLCSGLAAETQDEQVWLWREKKVLQNPLSYRFAKRGPNPAPRPILCVCVCARDCVSANEGLGKKMVVVVV